MRLLRIIQGPVLDLLGYPEAEATLRLQVQLSVSINLNLSISQPYFVFKISQPPNMAQKWLCIQRSQMDLSFQERKTVCNSVSWFTSYNNFRDTGEFRRFFFKRPVVYQLWLYHIYVIQSCRHGSITYAWYYVSHRYYTSFKANFRHSAEQ